MAALVFLIFSLAPERVTALPERHQLVVFAVDGFVSKTVLAAHMPLLQKFTQLGGVTTTMRTTDSMHSSSAGWISIFYSASPSEFGCNDHGCDHVPRFNPNDRSFLDILEEDHEYASIIFSENPRVFSNILERDDGEVREADLCTRQLFDSVRSAHLPQTDRRIVVVHLSCLDRLGAVSGYTSYNYLDRVHCLDKELSSLAMQLWDHAPNTTTFLLTSNHGGSGFTHTQFNLPTINVPFAAWGYGFKKHAHFMGKYLLTQQIAPTLFTALNISDDIPLTWLEKPMSDDVYSTEEGGYAIQYEVERLLPEEIVIDRQQCSPPFSTSHHVVRQVYIGMGVIFSLLLFISLFTVH